MARRQSVYCPPADPIVVGRHPFQAGWNCWREQGIPDWLLTYTTRGCCYYRHGDGVFYAPVGEIVLVRPRTRHDYGVDPGGETWEQYWAVFQPRPTWRQWMHWPQRGEGIYSLQIPEGEMRDVIVGGLQRLNDLAGSAWQHHSELAMNAMEAILLWCDAAHSKSGRSMLDSRLLRATDYICRNLSRNLGTEQIAATAGVSVSQVIRLFKRSLAMTPIQFVEQERLNRAQQLLKHTSMSVQAIAWEVGFENPFYFTSRFKRRVSQSPTQWRRMAAGVSEGKSVK